MTKHVDPSVFPLPITSNGFLPVLPGALVWACDLTTGMFTEYLLRPSFVLGPEQTAESTVNEMETPASREGTDKLSSHLVGPTISERDLLHGWEQKPMREKRMHQVREGAGKNWAQLSQAHLFRVDLECRAAELVSFSWFPMPVGHWCGLA